jgi:hypothetical protein
VHADSGYTAADKRVRRKNLTWQIAAKRGCIKAMADGREKRALERIEKAKACEGRASVPGDQAAVRVDEGAIPRVGQEHCARDHAVRAVESVDGTTAVVGDDGIVASAAVEKARSRSNPRVARLENRSSNIDGRRRAQASDPQVGVSSLGKP